MIQTLLHLQLPCQSLSDFYCMFPSSAQCEHTINGLMIPSSWVFVVDNWNTHRSETLVRYVAHREGIDEKAMGRKGKSGILKTMATRKAFLSDRSHRIRSVYLPKNTSWLSQMRSCSRHRGTPRRSARQLHIVGGPEAAVAGLHRLLQLDLYRPCRFHSARRQTAALAQAAASVLRPPRMSSRPWRTTTWHTDCMLDDSSQTRQH